MLTVNINRPRVEQLVQELSKVNSMKTDEFITNFLAFNLGIPDAQMRFSGPAVVVAKSA